MTCPSPRLSALPLLLAAFWAPPAWSKVDLTELSLENLMEVSISGASKYAQQQEQVAAAVHVITRQDIKAFGWRTLAEVLASLPGIHTTYDRQYTYLGARGFGLPGDYNTRVLLSINGNRMNDVVYDGALIGRDSPLDLDLIERIEFIPGPGGAVYGQNALFGVINVITRNGAQISGGEASLAYQSPQAAVEGRLSWGRKLDNGLDVVLSASGYHARGEDLFFDYGAAAVSGVAGDMDGERDQEFFARLARGAWSFDIVNSDHRKEDPTASFFADPLAPGQYQRDRYLVAELQYQDKFADDTLEVTGRMFLGRERYSGRFVYTGTPWFSTGSSDWHGGEFRLVSSALADHKLMLGMELQDNPRQEQTNRDMSNPANDVFIPGSGWRAGVFLQDEWNLSPGLVTTLGLRLDRNDLGDTSASPRAALIWQATPTTTLKALYGRAHRAPNAYERDYDDGVSQVANPALNGERIDTFELVADQRAGRNLRLRASVYHWRMDNLVTLGIDPGTGLTQYQSGEKIRANGLELSVDKAWELGSRLRGSLAYQDVAFVGGGVPANSPRLMGKLNFSGPLAASGLRLGAELQYSGPRRAIDGSDVKGYWLSNLQLGADLWAKGLEVTLGIYNLFDQRYSQPASDTNWQTALEQDGRSLRLKIVQAF